MEKDGERQVPDIPGTLRGIDPAHIKRYEFASLFTRGKFVYDIASGSGYGSFLLEAEYYNGFDISGEAVDYANEYFGGPHVVFHKYDACQLPEELPVADVITCFETIEHLTCPQSFLLWCSRHCKTLIISTPLRGSFPRSHYHVFEYRQGPFARAVQTYFPKVLLFLQTHEAGITYPLPNHAKGIGLAVCLRE